MKYDEPVASAVLMEEKYGSKLKATDILWSQHSGLVSSHLSLAMVTPPSKGMLKRRGSIYGRCLSYRIALAFLGLLIFLSLNTHRVSMSIAIVRMVNHTAVNELASRDLHATQTNDVTIMAGNVNQSDRQWSLYDNLRLNLTHINDLGGITELLLNESQLLALDKQSLYEYQTSLLEQGCHTNIEVSSDKSEDGPFVWDTAARGHMLGAFYYGYAASQIPGSIAAQRTGGKLIVSISMAILSICSAAIPLVANLGYGYVVAMRILIGVGSGALYPALMAVLGRWSPPLERTKVLGIVFAGGGIGLIVAHPIAGILCRLSSDGWSLVFYGYGALTFVALIPWLIFASDTPANNRFISTEEKEYIQESLLGQVSLDEVRKVPAPWLKVARSLPVWAIGIAMITSDWGYSVYLSYIPTYMHEVLHLDIQQNSLFSCLPFLGHTMVLMLFPVVIDSLIKNQILSPAHARKTAHILGSVGAAIMLIALSFVDCRHAPTAVTLLALGVTSCACVYSGFTVNIVDIAPVHAGTILAFTNTMASITGFLSPMAVTALTPMKSHAGWQHVFYVSAAIYVIGAIFYCLFGSTDLQPWGLDCPGPDVSFDSEESEEKGGLGERRETASSEQSFLSNIDPV